MYSPSIQKMIDEFSKFPTVGSRTAARFAFYLMSRDQAEANALAAAILGLKKNVKTCRLCFNAYESEKEICGVCADPKRDKSLLCVVANETDLAAMEKLKAYKGLYFVLGGTISSFKKESLAARRTSELEKRVGANRALKEIILAINPTSEGSGTILHLERCLKPFNVRVTKLGLGLPVGGELEYADEETLSSALNGRK